MQLNKLSFFMLSVGIFCAQANCQIKTSEFTVEETGNQTTVDGALNVLGDGLYLNLNRKSYVSYGSEVGLNFNQLTHNGAFKAGGAIKAISVGSYIGGTPISHDSDLVLYSAQNSGLFEGFRLTHNGNIGIGVYPDSKFHIKGNDLSLKLSRQTYKAHGSEIGVDFSHLTDNGAIKPGGAIKSLSVDTYTGGVPVSQNSDLGLYSAQNGNLVEGFRLTHNGNIGIGVYPDSKFHIKGNDLSLKLSRQTYKAYASEVGIDFSHLTDNGANRPGGAIKALSVDTYTGGVPVSQNSDLVFYSTQNGVLLDGIHLTYHGNVGIGTYPESKFHIVGNDMGLKLSRKTYKAYGAEVGIDFSQLTDNGANKSGGAIKSVSVGSYTGGTPVSHDSHLVLYSVENGNLVEGIRITGSGSVAIGRISTGPHKLAVQGSIGSSSFMAENVTSWSDFVFGKEYELIPLEELESFIKHKGHLPGLSSEEEIKETGFDLAEMDATLLQKIEELTLYVIQLNKELEELKKNSGQLRKKSRAKR